MWWLLGLALAGVPEDEALSALAEGRTAAALNVLRRAVHEGAEPAAQCLLAEVALLAGRADEALEVAEEVPAGAPCRGRAEFLGAEALLALGRTEEAAERYEELGSSLRAGGRHDTTAARLEGWAERVFADESKDPAVGHQLLGLALELDLDADERVALATRIAEAHSGGAAASSALRVLSEAVAGADGDAARERRALSAMLPPEDAWALLAPLPDEPVTAYARAQVARRIDLETGAAVGRALHERWPDSDEARQLALEHGRAWAAAGAVVEATELLEPLAGEHPEAAWALARLAASSGDAGAISMLDRVIAEFGTEGFREEAEELRSALWLRRARGAAAEGRLDAEAWDAALGAAPDDAGRALERALVVAMSGGGLSELESVAARWPWTDAATRAREARVQLDPDPAAGLRWIRHQAEVRPQVADELAALLEPRITVRADGVQGRRPVVQVEVRGLEELELRLHRIDVEGFLRSGGTPDGLRALDVALIAPDRTWTVPVPDAQPGRRTRFEVPVEVPAPGLYAVTAATHDREARTVLLVSDLELVVRARGADVAVAAFREGAPASGVDLRVQAGTAVWEARTGAGGVARLTVPPGRISVLGLGRGGPALLALDRPDSGADTRGPRLGVDLDRPVYLPGDTARFRVVAAEAGAPVSGRWRIELVDPSGLVLQVLRARADAFGAVEGEVVLPLLSPGSSGRGALEHRYALRATPPWSDSPVPLGDLRVVDTVPVGHTLTAVLEADRAVARLTDERGVPIPGAPVRWTDARTGADLVVGTDAAGEALLDVPPAGLPFAPVASLPGSDLRAPARAPQRVERALELSASEVRVTLSGPPGPVEVRVARLLEAPTEPPRVGLPGVLVVPPELLVHEAAPEPEYGATRTVWRGAVELGEGSQVLELPELGPGRYRVIAAAPDARSGSAEVELERTAGPRFVGPVPEPAGVARVAVEGTAALVTAEDAGRIADAVGLRDGRSATVEVDAGFHGDVRLVASGPHADHVRSAVRDGALQVELDARADGDRLHVRARVLDPTGAPARAQVALKAFDAVLRDQVGAGAAVAPRVFEASSRRAGHTGRATTLVDGGVDLPVAAELLAEARRDAEARIAARASAGRLGDNAVRDVLGGDVPLVTQSGGFGARGSGSGAGGLGSAGGGLGGKGVGHGVAGTRSVRLRGWRGSVLWTVLEADGEGWVEAVVPLPEHRTRWTVLASAIAPGTMGSAEVEVEPERAPYVVTDALEPGWPDDVARPRAWVVNPGPSPAEISVALPAGPVDVRLEPGAASRLELGALAAGERLEVGLGDRRHAVHFPLRRGDAAPEGALLSIPVRESPLAALALEPDPQVEESVGRAAVAGRAALVALPHLEGAARQRAEARVRAAVGAVRSRAAECDDARAPEALLLVAGAAELLELPPEEIARVAELLDRAPTSPRERVARAWARTVAGQPVDDATLGRLQRDVGSLDGDGRALLLRLLRRRGLPTDGVSPGTGPHALRGRDAAALLSSAPPPVGDPGRPAWVEATARLLAGAVEPIRDRSGALLPVGPDGFVRVRAGGAVVPEGVASWRMDPPEWGPPAWALRVPATPAGLPAEAAPTGSGASCAADGPCRVRPGEAVALWGRSSPEPSGGLAPGDRPHVVRARVPGTYRLRLPGSGPASLVVEVSDERPSPLLQAEALISARSLLEVPGPLRPAGVAPPAALLGRWPSLEDWAPGLRGEAAELRLEVALAEGLPEQTARFEDLRDERPDYVLDTDDVAELARAYRGAGRPERAIAVWGAAIGATFLEDAAIASRVEPLVGRLASVQLLRSLADLYPAVPVVREAQFALPDRLLELADGLPDEVAETGLTPSDLRLMAAAWDRELIALVPGAPSAPEAGLRLATGLYRLGAKERTVGWTRRLRRAYADHPLLDRFALLEALAQTDLGRMEPARRLLEDLATTEFPAVGGGLAPSSLRGDARFALARLHEALQRPEVAAEWYERSGLPEAELSVRALTATRLEAERIVRVGPGRRVVVPVQAANVDEVHLRVHRVDLRALFLRESGLPDLATVRVDGLAPVWTGRRSLGVGPFGASVPLELPLEAPGAYLVQADAGEVSTSVLVLRSALEVTHHDLGDSRRVSVRRAGRPVPGAAVRAIGGGGVFAVDTDIRGAAVVPGGAAALVALDGHYALTSDASPGSAAVGYGAGRAPGGVLLRRLEAREAERREASEQRSGHIGAEGSGGVRLDAL